VEISKKCLLESDAIVAIRRDSPQPNPGFKRRPRQGWTAICVLAAQEMREGRFYCFAAD
jgi:hypothetical protein